MWRIVENRFVFYPPYSLMITTICILFIFGRIVVPSIHYSTEYFNLLFGTALVICVCLSCLYIVNPLLLPCLPVIVHLTSEIKCNVIKMLCFPVIFNICKLSSGVSEAGMHQRRRKIC